MLVELTMAAGIDRPLEQFLATLGTRLKSLRSQHGWTLEQLCTKDDANQVVSTLLKKFDVVTGLSAWSDPKHTH